MFSNITICQKVMGFYFHWLIVHINFSFDVNGCIGALRDNWASGALGYKGAIVKFCFDVGVILGGGYRGAGVLGGREAIVWLTMGVVPGRYHIGSSCLSAVTQGS